jgi:NitT/TauT family transport system substrate-binding protein
VIQSAQDMKEAGMLAPHTDLSELAEKAFVQLPGVTDEWLNGLEVEKLADGDVPPGEDIRQYAKLILSRGQKNCCIGRE